MTIKNKSTFRHFFHLPLLALASTTLLSCTTTVDNTSIEADLVQTNETLFQDASQDIFLEKLNRRKWDNPVVADFDQDGHTDLLLMDHGRLLKLHWNNGNGGFLKPVKIKGGDLHGIAVGDFNQNGKINLVVSQGGGAGTNLRKPMFYEITKQRKIVQLKEASSPFIKGRGRGAKLVDADNDGDLDLILPGALPPKGTESQNFVFENTGHGVYKFHSHLPLIRGEAQKLKITDFNNDNILDLIFYGAADDIIFMQGKGDLSFSNVTTKVLAGAAYGDVTGIAEIDIDNDGDFDLYLNRSGEIRQQYLYYDELSKNLAMAVRRGKKVEVQTLQSGKTLTIKNFQKVLKKRIYLGESKTLLDISKKDWHAGVDFILDADSANGFPKKAQLEKDSVHIGYVGNGIWRVALLTNFLGTTVISDVTVDEITPIIPIAQTGIMLENQDGIFTDVTEKSALNMAVNTTGTAVGDFNNDGYSDLFMVKYGNLASEVKQSIYLNKGNGAFIEATNHQIIAPGLATFGMGADTLDYNNDGLLDLTYSNERGLWHLYKNSLTENENRNFVKIRVGNSPSGKATALGAKVTITINGNSQTKRIGYTAAPYSQSFDDKAHFGLADASKVEKVQIQWTNGEKAQLNNVAANATYQTPKAN